MEALRQLTAFDIAYVLGFSILVAALLRQMWRGDGPRGGAQRGA